MKVSKQKPPLLATVFSDYICPFCYIGDLRLDRLRAHYDLKINWMLVEIHPETPVDGMPVNAIGYSDERWQQMMDNLLRLAAEEGVSLRQPAVNANSHQALLLAEAAKGCGADVFYRLHRGLFEAYFGAGKNIGDEHVLRELAVACEMPEAVVDSAWSDARYGERLQLALAAAGQYQVRATPTVFFSEHSRLDGAVGIDAFFAAAEQGLRDQQTA